MTEPLFFDCLTDAQFWSLFDAGVLHAYRLPVEVYQRLERIAPAHGCYLFTWPEGVDLPSLHDLVRDLAVPADEPAAQARSDCLETGATEERLRSAIEAFCARANTEPSPEGRRIHVVSTNPRPELRAGPYLEPQARDLTAMSLPELEAYLDDVLRVEEDHDVGSADSSASG